MVIILPPQKLGNNPKKTSTLQKFLNLQPKILPFLAGTTAALFGGPIAGAKVFGLTGLGAGILTSSQRARKVVKEKVLQPTKIGEEIGKIIDEPSILLPKKDETIKEKALDIAKEAGLVAGGVSIVGGTALAGKKIVDKIKSRQESLPIPSLPTPDAIQKSLPIPLISGSPPVPSFTDLPGEIAPVVATPQKSSGATTLINQQINISK